MDDDRVQKLRRADFWTALVLLGLAMAMLVGAFGFPITDSYGGVQNVWYVSPALFPLLVASALAILSLVLLANAIRTGGAAAALAQLRAPALAPSDRQQKLALMALLLVGYVYGFVPFVDYVVGTVFFLLAFVAAFHLSDGASARLVALAFLGLSLPAAILGAVGLMPAPGTTATLVVDGLVLAALVLVAVVMAVRLRPDLRPFRTVLSTSVLAPLILAATFKYGLLVPLPREGLVVGLMDVVRYALRAARG